MIQSKWPLACCFPPKYKESEMSFPAIIYYLVYDDMHNLKSIFIDENKAELERGKLPGSTEEIPRGYLQRRKYMIFPEDIEILTEIINVANKGK